jgi:hypothetical protein
MRFLIDAQLPPALVRWLIEAGHEAEHVVDRGMQAASDAAIWNLALREHAAIVTKDEDFAQRHVVTGRVRPWSGSGSATHVVPSCWLGLRLRCPRYSRHWSAAKR